MKTYDASVLLELMYKHNIDIMTAYKIYDTLTTKEKNILSIEYQNRE